jgi:ElaB/YqjD/DUF883 family membrane-anchored ribosome-binding protein
MNAPRQNTANGLGTDFRQTASEAAARISDAAQQATQQAKQSASDVASTVTHQVKDILNQQVGTGADMVGHLAHSAQRAAEDLDDNAPQLAGLVRGLAGRIEGMADEMRDRSVDELVRAASDFTRRQPALVFGLAALAGFFVLRTVKSAPTGGSMMGQHQDGGYRGPSQGDASRFQGGGASGFHGA